MMLDWGGGAVLQTVCAAVEGAVRVPVPTPHRDAVSRPLCCPSAPSLAAGGWHGWRPEGSPASVQRLAARRRCGETPRSPRPQWARRPGTGTSEPWLAARPGAPPPHGAQVRQRVRVYRWPPRGRHRSTLLPPYVRPLLPPRQSAASPRGDAQVEAYRRRLLHAPGHLWPALAARHHASASHTHQQPLPHSTHSDRAARLQVLCQRQTTQSLLRTSPLSRLRREVSSGSTLFQLKNKINQNQIQNSTIKRKQRFLIFFIEVVFGA